MKELELDTIDKFAILQEVELFKGVPAEDLWTVAAKAKVHSSEGFSWIIEENETPAVYFYIIADGTAVLSNGGYTIRILDQNDFYGEDELVADKKYYKNSIRPLSKKTIFIKVSKGMLLTLFEIHATLSRNISKKAAEKYLRASRELAREREKTKNIDSVIAKFDKVAMELFKGIGKEEVERKYLLTDDFNEEVLKENALEYQTLEIEQIYLKIEENREERIRKFGESYFRTIKEGEGKDRHEHEWLVEKAEFEKERSERAIGTPIEKTRYLVKTEDFKEICVDIYKGSLFPLKFAEIEFMSAEASANFKIPAWLKPQIKKEVTEDKAYKNKNLALNGLPKK